MNNISLQEFIAAKPKELRLGQWFVNCYFVGADVVSARLFYADDKTAEVLIRQKMEMWQWDSLPPIPERMK